MTPAAFAPTSFAPTPDNSTIYVVDDDKGVRDALGWLLRTKRLANHLLPSAESFLSTLSEHFEGDETTGFFASSPSVLLLDVRMGAMSGLSLFERLIALGLTQTLPVVFLTGHGELPMAVDAVKRGAFDFFEKPFANERLLARLGEALVHSQSAIEARQALAQTATKVEGLTEREHAVMCLVVQGLQNKQIADKLDISVRTVEVHRARIFEKMGVASAVELANMLR